MTDIKHNSEATPEIGRETAASILSIAFIKNTKTVGIAMIIIGFLSILLPNLMGIAINTLVGMAFLLSSLVLAFNAWYDKSQNMSLWFKPLILAALAIIIFTRPGIILGALGLLIAIYFLISGFSSILLSFELQSSAKLMSLLNGFITFVLSVIVLTNWPFSSAWIIGIIIGVTFIFDGITLLSIADQLKKTQEKAVN